MTTSRPLRAMAAVTLVVIGLLWLLPPIGFVAAMVLLVVVPPWGRTLSERAVISGVVVLGLVAIVFPRAGSTPITHVTAALLVSALLVGALGLRLVPQLREVPIPRPTVSDAIVAALALVSGWWFMAAYLGRSATEIVSGLFYTGWDNHGHFTTFANTYVEQSTSWTTVDGSTAWNQWYPSLQTTVMALGELASTGASTTLDRVGLLWPYVQWNATLFALALAALAWVAADLAGRLAGPERAAWARPLGAAGMAAFALLGSPGLLYNQGFTNFVLGVAVVVVVAYVSARSWRSARMLGWFLIPLGTIAVLGLWTPLVLGLVPSGIVVVVALLKHRRWMGITWLAAAIVVGVVLGLTQAQAILGVNPEQGAGDFAQSLGAVDVGMTSFNAGAALAAPLIVVLLAVLLAQRHRWPLVIAVAGPVLGAAAVTGVFVLATDAAGTGRLQSYYVLKPMYAMLLSVTPIVSALVGVLVARALSGVRTSTAVVTVALAAVIVIPLFGYVGSTPDTGADGLRVAPGVQAGVNRSEGVGKTLVGEVIIGATDAAEPFPDDGTLVWDGGGTLENLWVASLHGTLSRDQQTFYLGLSTVPYNAKTLAYVDFVLNLHPRMRLAALWFLPESGDLLQDWAAGRDRVDAVQVPLSASRICPDCAP